MFKEHEDSFVAPAHGEIGGAESGKIDHALLKRLVRHDDVSPLVVGSSRLSAGEVVAPGVILTKPQCDASRKSPLPCIDADVTQLWVVGTDQRPASPLIARDTPTLNHALAAEGERLVAALCAQHRRSRP